MKIEKVNDHQIRCTLTREDLADRELKISELAYGTEKAKSLFRDMMQQASFEFGFEAEDIPLMIEAIPLNSECIVLIITKVEDPEELDTRFSKFAPSVHEGDDDTDDLLDELSEGADEVLDLFKKIHEDTLNAVKDEVAKKPSEASASQKDTPKPVGGLTRIFSFNTLHELMRLARILRDNYHETNSLYKNEEAGSYLLTVAKGDHTPEEYNKICNILSEYGTLERVSSASEAYLEEHFTPLIKNSALQSLAEI